MTEHNNLLDLAHRYRDNLPGRIRHYLNQRGIPDTSIDGHLLGWGGWRITIPICNRQGEVAFFKLAKDPEDTSDSPKMFATPGAKAELYGWEHIAAKPKRIIICEGEFDRLVLEARGFTAVTSTAGAATFLPEWAEALRDVTDVYVCFDTDAAGRAGAERVARMIPRARIVRLPDEVGDGGDVTDFFVRLARSPEDFARLLDSAQFLPAQDLPEEPAFGTGRPKFAPDDEIDRLKSLVPLESLAARYVPLRRRGQNYVAHCPFHDDHRPSFVVFPPTQTFYCFGCRAHGDVLTFIMQVEHLTFSEALKVLRKISP